MPLSLSEESVRFRNWAQEEHETAAPGEWETLYEDWESIYRAFSDCLACRHPGDATDEELLDMVYLIARDNEAEWLIGLLTESLEWLETLIPVIVSSDETEAKWQLAGILESEASSHSEQVLLTLLDDGAEYVRRRALMALGKIGSAGIETACDEAWESGDEYQRIAVLHALRDASSERLPQFLQLALEDGREYLCSNANEIGRLLEKRGGADGDR